MYDLSKFNGRTGRIGRPLPDPWPVFARNKIHFRHGATSMLAGKPGSFKSITGLNIALKWVKSGKGVLYFAADSDEATVAKRVSSILTGDSTDTVETAFNTSKTGKYTAVLKTINGSDPDKGFMRFVYRQLDIDGIADQAASFETVDGDWPDAIFIDNLIDFVDRPDDWGSMLLLTKELEGFAKETKTHICVLHHAKLDGNQNGDPPQEWEIQGRITQVPHTVLTVGALGNHLKLSCEKNRNGPQKQGWIDFKVADNFRITDYTEVLRGEMQ